MSDCNRKRSGKEIQNWLIVQLSERLDIHPGEIDIREPFGSFGLSSSEAVVLTGDLEEWLGTPVSSTVVWDYPNIDELSRFLAGERQIPISRETGAAANEIEGNSIAVIGMACRFPQADSPEAYWKLLHDGVDAITEIPKERWNAEDYYSPEPATPGKMISKWGGFIEKPEWFDAPFFGVSPREAEALDPQQRLLLETAWEALENAGIPPSRLAESPTGVFIGICTNDYSRPQSSFPDGLNAYYGTGTAVSVAANRLSYFFDWRGPSVAVDTACSSSLVAIHLACQNLIAGECDLALAGGVNLILSPDLNIVFSQARMLSPDGRCRTFDAAANGYVRGEGCGVVVLKKWSQAIAGGDPILAVIRSSAVNQDGRSNGLTAPNGPSQESVIRKALEKAGLRPDRIDYVETHGTGTPLGDPIEVESIKSVLLQGREQDRICYIGSVKTNIGHLEAAAGIAGLMKVVLMLQHREIPPHLHFDRLNPHISLDGAPFAIATELRRFNRHSEPLRCGVSSFGFGGTNVHVILEEAPVNLDKSVRRDPGQSEIPSLIPLSASSPQARDEFAASLLAFLIDNPNCAFTDVVHTLTLRRTHLDYRLGTVAKDCNELIHRLSAYGNGITDNWSSGRAAKTGKPRIAFVFTGQGTQWAGMGRDLVEREPVFARAIHRLETLFAAHVSWSLLKELKSEGSASHLDRTDYAQPIIFALQIALVELWRSWGIAPDAVVGHSMGEIAAAYVAGAMTLEDAAVLMIQRGDVMQSCVGKGSMAAVSCSFHQASQKLLQWNCDVAIAAMNGPASTILSGSPQSVRDAMNRFEREGVSCKPLNGSYAFHSPQMEPLKCELIDRIRSLTFRDPRIPMISTVTGKPVRPGDLHSDYWANNIREPVLFHPAIETLIDEGFNLFLEIGPHPALCGNIAHVVSSLNREGAALPSLRRGQNGRDNLLESLGKLYTMGVDIDWKAVHPFPSSLVRLPNYPWQRERFWRDGHFGLACNGRVRTRAMQSHSTRAIRKDWLYQLHWVQHPFENRISRDNRRKTYIIFEDATRIGFHLAQIIQESNNNVIRIERGLSFASLTENRFQINLSSPHDFHELFHFLYSKWRDTEYVIVYLWGFDAQMKDDALCLDLLQDAEKLTCLGPIYLMQSLHEIGAHQKTCVWFATQGTQIVENRLGSFPVAQSLVWGIGRAIAHEFSDLFGGIVDLDPQDSLIDRAQCIFDELIENANDLYTAYRENKRYVSRLREFQTRNHSNRLQLDEKGSYLITGGLGTLGLRAACRLAERGARELILMARTPLPPRETWEGIDAQHRQAGIISRLRELESQGAIVRIVCGDVSNERDVRNLLEREKNENWASIRGIIHAAGDLRAKPVCQIDEPFLDSILRAKVLGTWLLHWYFQNRNLDFFVMFSSASSLFAPSGHAGYAAANSFLDCMARYRRAKNQNATSIGWGVWEDSGLAARSMVDSFNRNRMELIDFHSGLDLFERLTVEGIPHLYAISGGWKDWLNYCPELRKDGFLQDVIKNRRESEAIHSKIISERKPIQDILQQTERENRLSILRQFILSELARVLKIEELRIDLNQSLLHLGFDSLMAVEMKNRIETNVGIAMPVARLLEGKSINEYAELLFSMLEMQESNREKESTPLHRDESERETIQL